LRFLIDADLSHRVIPLFEARGHDAVHVDALGHGTAPDPRIAVLARQTDRCIVTADAGFGNLLDYKPREFAGIVVLTLPVDIGPIYIARLVDYFLSRLPELGSLHGKLLIVELGRIRVRE
jgi:predicted nuclease of predicted toxin-antitoxin system